MVYFNISVGIHFRGKMCKKEIAMKLKQILKSIALVSVITLSLGAMPVQAGNTVNGHVNPNVLTSETSINNTYETTNTATNNTTNTTTGTDTTSGTSTSSGTTSTDTYISELTGLPIAASLQNQRPIAVMVDNERRALNHYGVSEADIVYEMMNSTKNGRITRLMCIYKDWNNIPVIGNIRSVRPTNIPLASEYNAVIIHDGGPYYINAYFNKPYAAHLSAGFTRIPNGKPREFTEYVLAGEAARRMAAAGISTTYNEYRPGRDSHFLFHAGDTLLSSTYTVSSGRAVDLSAAFVHNSSKLMYNEATQTYDYYEYGSLHVDAEDNASLTFKNVILQNVSFAQLDTNGYMIYNYLGVGTGYYLTNGECIPIAWMKNNDTLITRYFDVNGNEIFINPGKTYIGLVPTDYWDGIVIR